MKKKLLVAMLPIASVLLASCSSDSESTKTVVTDNPKASEMDILVHEIFKNYAAKGKTAGFSIALIDGNITNQYNYGETKIGNAILPNSETLYEVGSITKTFTALTSVVLINENSLSLQDPIKNFLPSSLASRLSKNGVDVTFKHLLNHTSGFPRIPSDLPSGNDPYSNYNETKVINYIAGNELLRTPGTQPVNMQQATTFYSNFAYGVAGVIMENNFGLPLQNIMSAAVLVPLGMTSTTFENIESATNKAFPHNGNGVTSYWHFSALAAAGGLKSNLSDMVKYARFQMETVNATPLGVAALQTQNPTVEVQGQDLFGLGWEYYVTSEGKQIVVKDGGTGGFTSFIAFDRVSQKAVVALFNNSSDNNPSEPLVALLNAYFN